MDVSGLLSCAVELCKRKEEEERLRKEEEERLRKEKEKKKRKEK